MSAAPKPAGSDCHSSSHAGRTRLFPLLASPTRNGGGGTYPSLRWLHACNKWNTLTQWPQLTMFPFAPTEVLRMLSRSTTASQALVIGTICGRVASSHKPSMSYHIQKRRWHYLKIRHVVPWDRSDGYKEGCCHPCYHYRLGNGRKIVPVCSVDVC